MSTGQCPTALKPNKVHSFKLERVDINDVKVIFCTTLFMYT